MKTNLLTFTAWAAFAGILSAQPTLQNNVFPSFGDVVIQTEADTNGIHAGAGGANQTWDFDALTPIPGDNETQSTFGPAAGTPFASQFPGANACAIVPGTEGTFYGYFKVENNQISFHGSATDDLLFVYTDPEINLKTPLSYLQPFTDTYANSLSFPDGDGEIFGRAIKAVEYDAYGTLKMPDATYPNAMRLKTVEVSIDSFAFDGGYGLTTLNTTNYDWYVANRPGPQVSISYSSGTSKTVIDGIPPMETAIPLSKSVNYVIGATTAIGETPEQALGLRIESLGPNPATETLTLRFQAETAAGELLLLLRNAVGQTLQSQTLNVAAGENTVTLPVSQLPAGQYFMSLTNGRAVKTLAWMKQ